MLRRHLRKRWGRSQRAVAILGPFQEAPGGDAGCSKVAGLLLLLLLGGRAMVVDDLPPFGKSAKNQGEEAMRSFAVGEGQLPGSADEG